MYVRQLMADFRRIYHVSYMDVPTDEAIVLASMLGGGSAYAAALDPRLAWGMEETLTADLTDAVLRLTHMLSDAHTTEGAPTVPRPGQVERVMRERARAARVKKRIEETEWEEADV
jgi:hypothetical protein